MKKLYYDAEEFSTYIYDTDGKILAILKGSKSDIGIVPIPLYKGMEITFREIEGIYEVIDWNFHIGYIPEIKMGGGLRITVQLKA